MMIVPESDRYFGVGVVNGPNIELWHYGCAGAPKTVAPEKKLGDLDCRACGKRIKLFRDLGDGHIEPAD